MLRTRLCSVFSLLLITSLAAFPAEAPKIVKNKGHYQLLVDGQLFFVLGAQINNSSSWPSTLPQVWPAIEAMHVNTVDAPVY